MAEVLNVTNIDSGRLEAPAPRTAVADAADDKEKADDGISSSDDDDG
eukprot:CAMPEP_0172500622 /NCGR_PEP_ID=MMETSP1066-20121228/141076_1 /TAXON_ID=671091 /ORGANISM="Coscinodiscus wailesii, Strain CCMP2513" /LENGTH=46 /DNA_ID= /DNA_START= /DNA_END= /DNA_ORIENTATION=